VERFAAVDGTQLELPPGFPGPPGAYGCLLSHLAVVKQARENGMPDVLIFEDDAFFARGFDVRFSRYMGQVPGDWDLLFLGGNHSIEPLTISRNVVHVSSTLTSHAYAIKNTAYDYFIRYNENFPNIFDINNTHLQKIFRCYCFRPNLVGQEQGLSDISSMKAWRWI
jgi:GR25 family glycosyltransferase involved in LPS biosynthesis